MNHKCTLHVERYVVTSCVPWPTEIIITVFVDCAKSTLVPARDATMLSILFHTRFVTVELTVQTGNPVRQTPAGDVAAWIYVFLPSGEQKWQYLHRQYNVWSVIFI